MISVHVGVVGEPGYGVECFLAATISASSAPTSVHLKKTHH